MMQTDVTGWLLEDQNPAVSYRTQTELFGMESDNVKVKKWIFDFLPADWYETKGLWYRYYVTALAECGLTYHDIPQSCLDRAFYEMDTMFDCGCGDFMLLTALIKLGVTDHPVIVSVIERLHTMQLPDGGFLCAHRLEKLGYTPKSCYKANLHALLFLAECHKKGVNTCFGQALITYFLNRNLFYRSTDKDALVLNAREGWRTIDMFYPFEVMRVGLQNIVEALSALGYGNDKRLAEAWSLLHQYQDVSGKFLLKGTLSKSYLPKERVGRPSKWVTFYILLAEKYKESENTCP